MKIKISDIKKIFLELNKKGKIISYDKNNLKLINSNKSKIDRNRDILEKLKNNLTVKTQIENSEDFFDIYNSIDIETREGSMSFSVCSNEQFFINTYDNMCVNSSLLSSTCFNKICDESKSAMVSVNPKYYNENDALGRISFYKNKFKLYLYNFSSPNYKNRYIFRLLITKIILGDDYLDILSSPFEYIKHGFFEDKTIGQEVYYYFLELYNYDRYKILKSSYDNFFDTFNRETFEEYYNCDQINDEYPPFDDVLYFDNSKYKDMNFPGIECLIFN